MKQDIEGLKDVIRRLHGVESSHVETVPVKESFQGKTVWEGLVEVFHLYGHPKAKKPMPGYMKPTIQISLNVTSQSYTFRQLLRP